MEKLTFKVKDVDFYLECDLQSKIDIMNRFLNGEIIEFRKKVILNG